MAAHEGGDFFHRLDIGSHHADTPEQITSVSIDMSPAFINGVRNELPNAQITFDKFHVVGHRRCAAAQVKDDFQTAAVSQPISNWHLEENGP